MSSSIEEIRQCIENSLKHFSIQADVEFCNGKNAISVYSNDDISLWLRLFKSSKGYYDIEVSSVSFPDSYRRRGIFTYLMNELSKLDIISILKITSVCTEAMTSWCEKNGIRQENDCDYVFERRI